MSVKPKAMVAADEAPAETARKRRVAHTAKRVTKGETELVIKDAERTRAEIIAVATEEFARYGYSGGRINEIAERTRTSKRMIYYYFGSKEGLYRAVLLEHYRRLRANEGDLQLETRPPLDAMRGLVLVTFDWYVANAAEVPLVMVENIHHAVHLKDSSNLSPLNMAAIDRVQTVYERGVREGVMRPGLRPVDIYMTIAATSFFNISNRYTFAAIFGHDMTDPAEVALRREAVVDTVLRYVAADRTA